MNILRQTTTTNLLERKKRPIVSDVTTYDTLV